MKKNLPYALIVALGVVVDQVTKAVITAEIPHLASRTVIPGFFNLTLVHNRGAIFGLGSRTSSPVLTALLMAAALAALGLVVYYFFKTPSDERLTKVALSLILAGALGNQVDRLIRGHVVDFLDLYIKNQHWPFFNVADSCISIGAVLLLISLVRRKPSCTPSS
ncbi:MAG: signal peptidase II [Candidatus Aminicenantes bacterium]|nr:signal peptidase II [Candidatus Aminicenantes bacterium]